MKAILILIFSTIIGANSFAIDSLKTDVTKATVFLSGAQVFRKSKSITVNKGVSDFILMDVSPNLNRNQIQATAQGSFLILDVKFVTEYVAPPAQKPVIVPEKIQLEMNSLNDSLLFIGFEKERIQAKLQNLNEEKRMIMQNQLIASGGISDTLPEFKEIVEFYRLKLDDIHELIHKWKKLEHYTSVRENKHRDRLNELTAYTRNVGQPVQQARTRYHIQVTTYADVATTGRIETNYMVSNAGWTPAYDLRANNTSDPMLITYKAYVYQNTGEEWENVDLVLSTYNRTSYAEKPSLGVWRLDYQINRPGELVPIQYTQNAISQVEMGALREEISKDYGANNVQFQEKFVPTIELSDIKQNLANVEFDVKLPYTINSDGSHKLLVINNQKVDADYTHFMLPRVDKKAYLLAKIGEWESLNLLNGQANIYFNQTFVGTTTINPETLADTMEITLGRNEGVVSTRKKVSEELKELKIQKRTVTTYTFEIEVWNKSKDAIELLVEDQIPVTTNEDITIKLVEASNVDHNDTTGKLVWKLDLKPGEKKVITFGYSVEHEKDKPIS